MSRGGRNLIILGAIAVLVSLATTGVSLILYRDSGDIYLDRSRPGFLPDEEETKQETIETDYSFPETGTFTEAELNEYIENLDIEIEGIRAFQDPFGEKALSNESLGI